MPNRRDFAKYVLAGGVGILASRRLWPSAAGIPAPPQIADEKFDLLIEGGTVIDPSQNLNGAYDVAIKQGKILEVSKNVAKDRALKTVSAKDRIVTPGFIDMHAHCYDGVSIGMNADRYCLGRGVTTVLDAGSAGYATFPNFRKYIIRTSTTRIVALVHISPIGNILYEGGLSNISWLNPELTAKMAMDNRPVVAGIKIQLSKAISGANDLEALKRALQAAELARLPLMVHIDDPYSPLPDILKPLRKGDVFTHCYNNHTHGILDTNGRIIPEAREARERGVIFDPAQGQTHFSFDVAEKCMQQGFLCDTISTDLTVVTVERRVFDLPTMVSKFIALGVPLEKAVAMVTSNPARVFDYGAQIGTLRPGSEADVSIFELRDGKFDFEDSDGVKRTGQKMLASKAVVRRGQLFINAV
ncbi:MAG TPA: amidohydrolase/deacetylase family metallohydrolase [Candidatus Acidoferrales bacterium]|jgi:dihydroorotase|nr:amidohydrolase/deacetylase family metallohydrolase [Candidatus Acidoferrales bacterium]